MKKILCYGDSNTFGFNPQNGLRYNENERWSGILKSNLKSKFEVIEKGLNNRFGFNKHPNGVEYCALKHLKVLLDKNSDIDLIILAIGTNDLQYSLNTSDFLFENGLRQIINYIIEKNIKIILIPPVVLDERILSGYFSCQFDNSSILKSKNISEIYKKISKEYNLSYFDFNEFVKPSDEDGLHYDKISHFEIAKKLTPFVCAIMDEN